MHINSPKFEITAEQRVLDDEITIYRIRAIRNFGNVVAGQLGGWLEAPENLSQFGLCWVADDAIVRDIAKVVGNSCVSQKAIVRQSACIFGNARIRDRADVSGRALVGGNSRIEDSSRIYGDAFIIDTCVKAQSIVSGNLNLSKDFN